MPLECGDEHRQERLEPLPADPVGGLPQHNERFAHGGIVHRKPHWAARPGRARFRVQQQSNGVLAVVASDRDKLVENLALLVLQPAAAL